MGLLSPELKAALGAAGHVAEGLVQRLERVERKLDRVLAAVSDEDVEVMACPHCGNTGESGPIENTSVMGEPERATCHACGESWRPDEQA